MINYGRLDRSITFYEKEGFQRIEAPWTVKKAVSNITKPEGKFDYEIVGKNKVLVTSGEQGFLYLAMKGFLPSGKYQAITPCFRDEIFDQTHTKYFIKNELIITDNISNENLMKTISICKTFFENELDHKVDIIKTDQGFDLECLGIEVGSYGIRSCDYLDWIYGTGLAEPRMTIVRNKILKIK